jgi:hypothetical protein
MISRDLVTPRQREALSDVLSTCIVSELLVPSSPLYLISAWISDIEIIDNAGGAFSALAPEWPRGPIRLSAVFERLASEGAQVFVAMNEHVHNQAFIQRLMQMQQLECGRRIRWATARDLHQKCFCGQPFAIRGSMNFTWNGLNAKEEQMTVSVNPAEVRRLRFELEDRWSQYIEEQA